MRENKNFSSAKIEVRGIAQLGERLNGIQEVSGAIFVANQHVVFVAVHGSPAVFRGLPVSFGLAVRLIHGNAGNRRHEIAHFPFFLHLFALPLDFPARLWYKKINAIEPNRPVRGASCSFAFNVTTCEGDRIS